MRTDRLAVLALAIFIAAPAAAAAGGSTARPSEAQAAIPFADLGGIYDWAADGNRGIYGNLDRFSSILVRGQECPVVSLTKSGPPPSKDHRWRSSHPAKEASRGTTSEQKGAPR